MNDRAMSNIPRACVRHESITDRRQSHKIALGRVSLAGLLAFACVWGCSSATESAGEEVPNANSSQGPNVVSSDTDASMPPAVSEPEETGVSPAPADAGRAQDGGGAQPGEPDAGQPRVDSGTPVPPPADAGQPRVDSGTPVPPPADAGQPRVDSGAPVPPPADAGPPSVDSGAPVGATGSKIIGWQHTDARKIPTQYINLATSNFHIAHWHTSHGEQIGAGMDALRALCARGDSECAGRTFAHSQDGSAGLRYDDSRYHFRAPGPGGSNGASQPHNCPSLSNPPPGRSQDCVNGIGASGRPWFVEDTERRLSDHPTTNVIAWAWCGYGLRTHVQTAGLTNYISGLLYLAQKYPNVQFIAQSPHIDSVDEPSTIASQSLESLAAAEIRAAVESGPDNLWMLDYVDIETHNPDGVSYAQYRVDDGLAYGPNLSQNWATDWIVGQNGQTSHAGSWHDRVRQRITNSYPSYCVHSPEAGETEYAKLNCALKGQAMWWLLARMSGWDGQSQ